MTVYTVDSILDQITPLGVINVLKKVTKSHPNGKGVFSKTHAKHIIAVCGNTSNRKINGDKWRGYGDAMRGRNGEVWQDNDPISFLEDGTLRNGHHRFLGLIGRQDDDEVTIEFRIAYDFPMDSFKTADTGRARSFADQKTIEYGILGKTDEKNMVAYIARPASYAARLMYGTSPSYNERDKMFAILRAPMISVRNVMKTRGHASGKRLISIPVQVAICLRMIVNPSQNELILDQLLACITTAPEMDKTTRSMRQRLEDEQYQHVGAQGEPMRAAIGWIGFDPLNRKLPNIRIPRKDSKGDPTAFVSEMRLLINEQLEEMKASQKSNGLRIMKG